MPTSPRTRAAGVAVGGVGKTFANAITVDSDILPTRVPKDMLLFATGAAKKRGAPKDY